MDTNWNHPWINCFCCSKASHLWEKRTVIHVVQRPLLTKQLLFGQQICDRRGWDCYVSIYYIESSCLDTWIWMCRWNRWSCEVLLLNYFNQHNHLGWHLAKTLQPVAKDQTSVWTNKYSFTTWLSSICSQALSQKITESVAIFICQGRWSLQYHTHARSTLHLVESTNKKLQELVGWGLVLQSTHFYDIIPTSLPNIGNWCQMSRCVKN